MGLLAAVAVFALAWSELVLGGALACLGDDGVPFASPQSLRGRLCQARGDSFVGPLAVGLALAAPVVLVGGGALAVVRRRTRLLVASAAIAFAALALATLPFLVLPSR